jgi:hypoxanthine phosphoribosyltransferase
VSEIVTHQWAGPVLGEVVVSRDNIAERVAQMGAEISAFYAGRTPLVVGVLKGAVVFMSDLARAIAGPLEMDFMAVSSYGAATSTSGVVRIIKDLDSDIAGRDILIVEDIIDSGLTLRYLYDYLVSRHPASVEICAMVRKVGIQRAEIPARWVGIDIEPAFVVGYGLDVAGRFRQLPDIHVVNEEYL